LVSILRFIFSAMWSDAFRCSRIEQVRSTAGVSVALIGLAVAVVGGCSSARCGPARGPLILEAKLDDLWDLARQELKRRHFRLDRVDRRVGLIETFPMTSRQWFEFWRRDVVDSGALAESSLQTIRRSVRLKIASAPPRQCTLSCRVTVERLAPAGSIKTSSRGVLPMCRAGTARLAALEPSPTTDGHRRQWIPLGNDPALEADILRSIEKATRQNR